jgi:surfactin synthase thioesterase subunit
LPDDDLVARVDARYGGIPPAIRNNPGALRLLLPALRADLQMVENYRHDEEPPLDVDILALGGTDDPAISATQINDWRRHTTREFSARLLPGGHFFLFQGTGLAAANSNQSSRASEEAPAFQMIVTRLERLIANQAEPTG